MAGFSVPFGLRLEMEEIMIVWALFDSETATVAKALPEHDVFSFGIGRGTEHIHLDLSDFDTAKTVLDEYPKPDVIFASPPCETWSTITIGSIRHFTKERGGLNMYWKSRWVPFDFIPKHYEKRMNGVKTAETLAKIINHYKPDYWAIENGTVSIIFSYLLEKCNLHGFKNYCNYYSYGFKYLKPTTIYSNMQLKLKKNKPDGDFIRIKWHIKNHSKEECAIERSKVPESLYKDILRQFAGGYT